MHVLKMTLSLGMIAAAALAFPASGNTAIRFAKGELSVVTAAGAQHFSIEIARSPDELAQGLMYRDHLNADAGMLFLFDPPRPVSFWMKNTLIPLDMIFIKTDGTIESIAQRAVPLSTSTIPSQGTVGAVLEVNGGSAERLGIHPGDRVVFPGLANP